MATDTTDSRTSCSIPCLPRSTSIFGRADTSTGTKGNATGSFAMHTSTSNGSIGNTTANYGTRPRDTFTSSRTGAHSARRRLTVAEMLVGQTLALAFLDPESTRTGGIVTNDDVVRRLVAIVGEDRVVAELNPRRRRHDERVAEGNVREEVERALRALANLGFVESLEARRVRLGPALLRFAEPVHGLEDRSKALEQLIARGLVERPDADEALEES